MKNKKQKSIIILAGCRAECRNCGTWVDFENIQIESIVPEKRGLVMNLAEPLFCFKCGDYIPMITLVRGCEYDLVVKLSKATP